MSVKRILITGHYGFLGEKITKAIYNDYELVYFDNRLPLSQEKLDRYDNLDIVLHLASPSCEEDFGDYREMYKSIVYGTDNMIELSNRCKTRLIYASSEAVFKKENRYGTYKSLAVRNIQEECKSYTVLTLPRIYDKDREKGLIRRIKDNKVPLEDINNEIEFVDLKDIIYDIIAEIYKVQDNEHNKVVYFERGKQTKTIKEIKEFYNI